MLVPNSYQTRVIAAWAVAAVRPIGEGTLLAAFLVALLQTNREGASST